MNAEDVQRLRDVLMEAPTAELRSKLQHFHKRKLQDGLVVPGRRSQIDQIVRLILEEIESRPGRDQ